MTIDEFDIILTSIKRGFKDCGMYVPPDIRKDKNFEPYLVELGLSYIDAHRADIVKEVIGENGSWFKVEMKLLQMGIYELAESLKNDSEPSEVYVEAGLQACKTNPFNAYSIKENLDFLINYVEGHKFISLGKGEGQEADYNDVLELLMQAAKLYDERFDRKSMQLEK